MKFYISMTLSGKSLDCEATTSRISHTHYDENVTLLFSFFKINKALSHKLILD